jgi:hypothetical protein
MNINGFKCCEVLGLKSNPKSLTVLCLLSLANSLKKNECPKMPEILEEWLLLIKILQQDKNYKEKSIFKNALLSLPKGSREDREAALKIHENASYNYFRQLCCKDDHDQHFVSPKKKRPRLGDNFNDFSTYFDRSKFQRWFSDEQQ